MADGVTPIQLGTITTPGREIALASSWTRTPLKVVSPMDHSTGSARISANTGVARRASGRAQARRSDRMAKLLGWAAPRVAPSTRGCDERRLRHAETGNGADGVGVEPGQRGEMPTALHVVAVWPETGRAGRQEHHALARQRRFSLPHGVSEITGCGQPERAPRRRWREQLVDPRPIGAHRDDRGRWTVRDSLR